LPAGSVDGVHPVVPADLPQLLSGAAWPAQHDPADHRRFRLATPFEDLDRDVDYIMRTAELRLGKWPEAEANAQIQVLHSGFYRNKGAYIFGKAINGHFEFPSPSPSCTRRKANWSSTRSCSTAG
jgi:hypothetical protein